jgi:hypothetical protein
MHASHALPLKENVMPTNQNDGQKPLRSLKKELVAMAFFMGLLGGSILFEYIFY